MEGYIAEIRMFAGNFAPRNWQYCAGQILSIAQNTALFSLVGTTYGGNGQTTFGLPDFRGRTCISPGQSPGTSNYTEGEMSGTQTTVLNITNLPIHNHPISGSPTVSITPRCNTGTGDTAEPVGNYPAIAAGVNAYGPNATDVMTALTVNASLGALTSSVSGSSYPFSILEPYLGMNYIICLYGIFPSRN